MVNIVKFHFGSIREEIAKKLSNKIYQQQAKKVIASNAIEKQNRYICAYCKGKTIFSLEPNSKLKWYSPRIFLNNRSNCKKNKYGHAYISWEYLEQLKSVKKEN